MLPVIAYPSGVYVIKNNKNGKQYIGSSVNLRRRLKVHYSTLERGVHKNDHLQSAWIKYGSENFSIKVIVYCNAGNATFYEQLAIDAINPQYNKCPSASSMLGFVMPRAKVENHKRFMRELWEDPEFRLMMKRVHRDRLNRMTKEERSRLSENGKKAWANHELMRSKIRISRKSSKPTIERLKNGSPELSEMRSKITSNLWLDGDYKKKQSDGVRALWEDDAYKRRRSKKIAEVNRSVSKRRSQGRFTDSQVIEIRRKRKAGMKLKELSNEYGASEGNLSLICSGKLYDWIPLE